MTDDDQISALFDQMCRAWTAGDAVAYGRCFTPDCDYVSFDGYREQGRDAMVESHDRLFRGVLFGSALVGRVESIRRLSDDIAVMHATGSVLVAWRSLTLPSTTRGFAVTRDSLCSSTSTRQSCSPVVASSAYALP